MLELRWMLPGDDGLKHVKRFPNRNLKLALLRYRQVTKRAEEADLFKVSDGQTVGFYDLSGELEDFDG